MPEVRSTGLCHGGRYLWEWGVQLMSQYAPRDPGNFVVTVEPPSPPLQLSDCSQPSTAAVPRNSPPHEQKETSKATHFGVHAPITESAEASLPLGPSGQYRQEFIPLSSKPAIGMELTTTPKGWFTLPVAPSSFPHPYPQVLASTSFQNLAYTRVGYGDKVRLGDTVVREKNLRRGQRTISPAGQPPPSE